MVTDTDECAKARNTSQIERPSSLDSKADDDLDRTTIDRKLERRTVLKLDLLLVSLMASLYLLAFLDR